MTDKRNAPTKVQLDDPMRWLGLLTGVCMTQRQLHCVKSPPQPGDGSWKLRPWSLLHNLKVTLQIKRSLSSTLYSSYNLWEELVNFVHLGYFFIDLWVVDFLSLVSFVYFLRLNDPPSRMECFNSEELSIQPCVKTLHIIFRCHTWRWLGGGKRETVILLSEFSLAQSKPVTQHLKDPFTWKLDRVFCFQIHFTWISNETYFV